MLDRLPKSLRMRFFSVKEYAIAITLSRPPMPAPERDGN
jgi:hypothetical protein